ncbi:MAG: hypothetical protein KDD70_17255 [Bdellovibrionales bacterium]|nr:hypothetical protein [Bdellovibrionales bacterium]
MKRTLLSYSRTLLFLPIIVISLQQNVKAQDSDIPLECNLMGLRECICYHLGWAYSKGGVLGVLAGGDGGWIETYRVPFNDVCRDEHGVEPGGPLYWTTRVIETPIVVLHATCMFAAGLAGDVVDGACWVGNLFYDAEEEARVQEAEARASEVWDRVFEESVRKVASEEVRRILAEEHYFN